MDGRAARRALAAWRALPRSVRAETVQRAQQGVPASDPDVGRTAVNWTRSWGAFIHVPLLVFSASAVLLVGTHAFVVARDRPPLLTMLWPGLLVPGLLALLAALWLYRGTTAAGAHNLRALVSWGGYPAQAPMQVRATRVSRWLVAGWIALAVAFLSCVVGSVVAGASILRVAYDTAFVGLFALVMPLSRRASIRNAGQPLRPPGGSVVLELNSVGLTIVPLAVTVPWSDVESADVVAFASVTLALWFRIRGRANAVALPAQWLDEDPGVILATAHHYLAQSRNRAVAG
jgi:hypothetical protein